MLIAFLSKTEQDCINASCINTQIYEHQGCEELYIIEFLWPPFHICLSAYLALENTVSSGPFVYTSLLKATDTVLGLWARVQNMPISEVIQTQFLKKDTVKDNVSQEFLDNWNDCFHIKAVLQIIPTAFMIDKKEFASKVTQKALKNSSQKSMFLRLPETYSTFLGPFPAKQL